MIFYSAVNVFSCQRPVTKVGPNGEEESWILKTYFSTEEMFPTVLRRSEIVDIQTIEISPIESALNDVRDKTKELNILKVRYTNLAKTGQAVSTNALSMSLDSAVDAPGNGGVSLYREAFVSPVYLIENPDRSDQVQRLREAIEEQDRTIDACLKLHKELCPIVLQALDRLPVLSRVVLRINSSRGCKVASELRPVGNRLYKFEMGLPRLLSG